MRHNTGYQVNSAHCCINAYKPPENIEEWSDCPNCGLKPKVWVFDNGRFTACGCYNNRYDHFSVRAESITSVYLRCNKDTSQYCCDDLLKNWNHWCLTGEHLFKPDGYPDSW